MEPERILSWEEFDVQRGYDHLQMYKKAERGLFCSAPPIIVSPLPAEYRGRYRHFLYNGHSRLVIAHKFNFPLFGLVAENDDDIPTLELIGDRLPNGRVINRVTLEDLLRFILSKKIGPHPAIDKNRWENYSSSYLVQEFMKWEQGKRAEYK